MCWRDEGVDRWEKATQDMCSFLYKADPSSDSEQRAYMSQQQLIPKAGSLQSLASSSPLFMSEKRSSSSWVSPLQLEAPVCLSPWDVMDYEEEVRQETAHGFILGHLPVL